MKIKQILSIVILTISITITGYQTAHAQTEYSNIKVDQLSDAQIKQMMKRAEEMGYTDAQIEQMVAARGMSGGEINKLRERVQKIRQGQSTQKNTNAATLGAGNEQVQQEGRIVNSEVRDTLDQREAKPQSRIFGSALFSNSNISFEPNMRMATPKGYIIGPDDELLLDLTGDNEASYKLRVSPEGFISLEYVGRISVGGLSIEQATNKIRSSMAGTYPALRSGRSQIALNLGNIRSIKVIINGEVEKPGTYTLPSLASVFNALYASGGPTEKGSFRKIQVIRNNNIVATVDIYDFLVNGIQTGNIRLQDQDVINVPVYQIRVDVVGEVKRSAIFEMLPSETLVDVLKYAGGFSEMAYSARVKIFQNTATERRIIDKTISEFPDYKPHNGDKVFVEPILDRFENKIQIAGAVFRPGMYELSSGLTLKDLIKQAEGLREDAFMKRGYIIRLNADNTTSMVPFDVSRIVQGLDADIALKREDIVQISSIFDLRDEYKVSIGGEVRSPGTFDYADNMSVGDLIQMAGGLKEGATTKRVEISRRIKNANLTQKGTATAEVFTIDVDSTLGVQGNNFILQPFDIVSIRAAEGFVIQKQVRIEGEVLYPGLYTINYKNERISDIIKRAGGLTAYAYAEGASLKRPGPAVEKDKNKIDDTSEEVLRSLNLQRLKQDGAKDSVGAAFEEKVLASDLVGINLVRILKDPLSRNDLILEDGDIVRVPTLLQTVKVTGEVLRPTSVVYVPGKNFEYYITSAGGFTRRAYKRGSYINYANGAAAGTQKSLFVSNYPKVKPGAEIAVPRRAERERMSSQAWVGIGTAVVALTAMIISLFK